MFPRRIYRTAPLLEQTSCDVESMIPTRLRVIVFVRSVPRPLLFRAIGPSSCRFIACKRFFLSCPFIRAIFARSHYHSYAGASVLFRKFRSVNSRRSVSLCFRPLYLSLLRSERSRQRYLAARYMDELSLSYFLTAPT